ncbi:MAG TPA: hypothetical protein VH877_13415 [Polyangia bacterium]|jgi:hypothetical protein|nr:hypothetical protein [Polyangia bacterium]
MRKLRHIALAFAPVLALAACDGGASQNTVQDLPVSSALAIEDTEDNPTLAGATQSALTVNDVSLLALAHNGLQEFNSDVRNLLDRIHRLASQVRPVTETEGRRVWEFTDGNTVGRLVIERARLGDVTYPTEDGVPAEESVRDDLPALDPNLTAFRFSLMLRTVTETDTAFRLAARGHLVRLTNEPYGSGVVVIYRDRVAEVDGALVTGRQRIAARYDHRNQIRRLAVRTGAVNSNGEVTRAAWIYRQFANRGGALKFVRWGDLPNTPVSGGQNELVSLIEHWVRTPTGLVARAAARITGGDLANLTPSEEAINIVECVNRGTQSAFRYVAGQPSGTVYQNAGERSACLPFPALDGPVPPLPDAETIPASGATQ